MQKRYEESMKQESGSKNEDPDHLESFNSGRKLIEAKVKPLERTSGAARKIKKS